MISKTLRDRSSIFSVRHEGSEMMDDLSIADERLDRALRELPVVNRWLGGYHATSMALAPIMRPERHLRILDLGSGIGDYAVEMVRMGTRFGVEVEVVAADLNPETVTIGREYVRERLGAKSWRVSFTEADAMDLPFGTDSFDIAHGALFLHHFADEEATGVLREMNRVARQGIIINDLHRHPIAYSFVRLLGHLPFFGEMFRHDGPISVLRAFRRDELKGLFEVCGLQVRIRWHPGFRWVATTFQGAR